MEEIALWCDTEVDEVWFMDDWGSQNSLLISPDMWREFFAPCYRDYINLAHSRGELDRQHLLPEGTPEQIDEAARLLKESFYRDGGFIVQCEFGPAARPDNILRYFAGFCVQRG